MRNGSRVLCRLAVYRREQAGILSTLANSAHRIQRVDASPGIGTVTNAMIAALEHQPPQYQAPAPANTGASPSVELNIHPSTTLLNSSGEVVVSVTVPDCVDRQAGVDICCVVDISASMSSPVTADGEEIDDGKCILDIVKHSVSTVSHLLGEKDRMTLVAFDHEAEIHVPLTPMTDDGRGQLIAAVESLRPRGQTNLWGGVHAGLEALTNTPETNRQKALFLLTDGKPNITPPRGHLHELKKYKDKHAETQIQINTFGFGYDLDSSLLLDLSVEGNGTFAFIPDAPIVGTTFVDATANILSTYSTNATLHLMPAEGVEFKEPFADAATTTPWGQVCELGPLLYGQTRQVAVSLVGLDTVAGDVPYLECVVAFSESSGDKGQVEAHATSRSPDEIAILGSLRSSTVRTGIDAAQKAKEGQGVAAKALVGELARDLERASNLTQDPRLKGLHADVIGRLSKALDGKDRFERWGSHYMRALIRAHQLQQCTNFLDIGLQHYGGALFNQIRETGISIFKSIPAPKPPPAPTTLDEALAEIGLTRATAPHDVLQGIREHLAVLHPPAPAPAPAPPQHTPAAPGNSGYEVEEDNGYGRYADQCSGGCFGSAATVVACRANCRAETVKVTEVKRGDLLMAAGGQPVEVVVAVHIPRPAHKKLAVLAEGLHITPGHPVRVDGEWKPARHLSNQRAEHDGFVYNFVLEREHVLLVDGVECVTWGHGFNDPAVKHPYYGDLEAVLKELRSKPGWQQGIVKL